jgi:hypothetical protein
MIVPLMANIVDELKSKKVDSVNVYLIGVSPKFNEPIFYDTQNSECIHFHFKLQGCKIEFKDEQRSTRRESPVTTNIQPIDSILGNVSVALQQLELELGINNIHLTYTYLSLMDLRPDATKTLILVNSEPCWESETEFVLHLIYPSKKHFYRNPHFSSKTSECLSPRLSCPNSASSLISSLHSRNSN